MITPSTLTVGVESRPGELPGVTKDKEPGIEGEDLDPSPPLQAEKRIKAQKTNRDFQKDKLRGKRHLSKGMADISFFTLFLLENVKRFKLFNLIGRRRKKLKKLLSFCLSPAIMS
jgi:hypothetical protein